MTDPMLPLPGLSPASGKSVVAKFDGGLLSSDGGVLVLREVEQRLRVADSRRRYPFIARVFADGGYAGRLVTWAADKTHITLEIIRRGAKAKGFEVLPRRWVVERTFAWIFKNRRLVRDYEQITAVAETLITIAASATLLRRWQ